MLDSSLLIIINYKIKNIAYYANSFDKPLLLVSNSTDNIKYKLISYVEENQIVIPFQSSESVSIKLSDYSEYIELTSCSVITI